MADRPLTLTPIQTMTDEEFLRFDAVLATMESDLARMLVNDPVIQRMHRLRRLRRLRRARRVPQAIGRTGRA